MAERPAAVIPLARLGRTIDIAFRANRTRGHGEESRQIGLIAGALDLDRRTARLLETIIIAEPVAIAVAIMAATATILTRGARLEPTLANQARLRLAFAALAFGRLFAGSEFAALALAAGAEAAAVLLLHGLWRAKGETIRGRIEIVIIIVAIISQAGKRSLLGLHSRGDEAVIMLGMLEIALRRHRITGEMRIAGELGVFLGDVLGRAADFYIRTVRFIRTRQRVGPATVATPHALVLSWSHPCFSRLARFTGGLGVAWRRSSGEQAPFVASGAPEGARALRQVFRSRIPAPPAQST